MGAIAPINNFLYKYGCDSDIGSIGVGQTHDNIKYIRSSNIKEVINMNDINLDTIGVSDGTIIVEPVPIND